MKVARKNLKSSHIGSVMTDTTMSNSNTLPIWPILVVSVRCGNVMGLMLRPHGNCRSGESLVQCFRQCGRHKRDAANILRHGHASMYF